MTAEALNLSDETRLCRNPNIIASHIDDETVMMNEEFDSYFGMAKGGTFIWKALETEITYGELIQRLTEAAGETVTEETCREETSAFLKELHENGLLNVGDE